VATIVLAKRNKSLRSAFGEGRYFIIFLSVFLVCYLGFSVLAAVIFYRYMYCVPVVIAMLIYMLGKRFQVKEA
jgi:hypothetical protein